MRQMRALVRADCGRSDDELQELQLQFRALADTVLDHQARRAARADRADDAETRSDEFLRLVPRERVDEAEERAAIREFDGGQCRTTAESGALADLGLVRSVRQ
jgi:hypothetical protein